MLQTFARKLFVHRNGEVKRCSGTKLRLYPDAPAVTAHDASAEPAATGPSEAGWPIRPSFPTVLLKGEFFRMARVVNTMVEQSNSCKLNRIALHRG
jgi:hypothetical protein